jgi:hypothetical protein
MLMKAIDMAIGIGGQIAGAAQRGSRPKPSIPTPQAEGEASVRSALAAEELSGALSSGPAAFQGALAETLPGGGAIEVSETLTPRRGLSPVVAGAAGAPEDIQGEYDVGVEAGRRAAIEKIAMGTTPERQRQVVAESSPAMVSGSWGSPASLDAVPISVASSPAISRESTPGPLGPALRNFLAQTPRTAPQASPAAAPAPAAAGRLTVSDVLQQLRREQAEREAQRSALMQIPQDLEGRGLGELRALMGFADSAEEAQRIMAAVRSSPDVQWTGIEDMTTGAHIARAQNFVAKGLRKHTAGRGTSTAAQMEDLLRTQAYMDTSAARAEASRASAEAARARASLIAKQEAELQAELDKAALDAAKDSSRKRRKNPEQAKREAEWAFYFANKVKHLRGEMDDATWSSGAGRFAPTDPPGMEAQGRIEGVPARHLKKATTNANLIARMAGSRGAKPPAATGLRGKLIAADDKIRSLGVEIPALTGPKREKATDELIRANAMRRDILTQMESIGAHTPAGGPTPSPATPDDTARVESMKAFLDAQGAAPATGSGTDAKVEALRRTLEQRKAEKRTQKEGR